ncbi:MAG: hypothetical protein JXB19_01400 [Bacteroidales bacterium]|nr:hypothetical protein [Bacteroidales bacterium]
MWISSAINAPVFIIWLISIPQISSFTGDSENDREPLLVPQNGFAAGFNKTAVVRTEADSFLLLNDENTVMFRGKLDETGYWSFSDEWVQFGDFSPLDLHGDYHFTIPGTDAVTYFTITENPFMAIADACIKAYYFNRSGSPVLQDFKLVCGALIFLLFRKQYHLYVAYGSGCLVCCDSQRY